MFQEQLKLYEENSLKAYESLKERDIEKVPSAVLIDKSAPQESFGLSVVCNVSGREAISAINRAKTSYCKQLILNTTCALRNGQLYPVRLPHSCPANGMLIGIYVLTLP